MSKIVSSSKMTGNNIISDNAYVGFERGPRLFSRISTQKTVYTNNFAFVVPNGVTSLTIKAWGGGGSSGKGVGNPGGNGGGGGYASYTTAPVPGDVYIVSVGNNPSNPPGSGGTGSSSGSAGGTGGNMSMVHLQVGSNYIIKAVAGGGGGGSASQSGVSGQSGFGGGGGNDGGFGGGSVSAAGIRGNSGGTGNGGSGGNADGTAGFGSSFSNIVTNIDFVGGSGGAGLSFATNVNKSCGGGGGSGWGGGGGGAHKGGGGGGGLYSASGSLVISGGAPDPANSTDPDYPAGVGVGGTGSTTAVNPGTKGAVVVIFTIITNTLSIPDEVSTSKASDLIISATNNTQTGTAGNGGNLILNAGTIASIAPATKGSVKVSGAGLIPNVDASMTLGGPSNRWTVVYAQTGTINTSDRREKTDIESAELGLNFINMLRPVRYKFLEGVRPHYGFVAQDVKKVLDELKLDFGGYIRSVKYTRDPGTGNDIEDGDTLGLRYEEFISPLTKAVQELSLAAEVDRAVILNAEKKNKELSQTVAELKETLGVISDRFQKLEADFKESQFSE